VLKQGKEWELKKLKGKEKHRQKKTDEEIILWQYSLALLRTCLRVSEQTHQSGK